jgi:hypothetical protein
MAGVASRTSSTPSPSRASVAVVGEPEAVAPELLKRYGDCINRISFYAPYKSDPERWAAVRATLQSG